MRLLTFRFPYFRDYFSPPPYSTLEKIWPDNICIVRPTLFVWGGGAIAAERGWAVGDKYQILNIF
jgi:hypothetical protein